MTSGCYNIDTPIQLSLSWQSHTSVSILTLKFLLGVIGAICYELGPLGLDNRTTLVLSNTRELNRELFYKLVYLI